MAASAAVMLLLTVATGCARHGTPRTSFAPAPPSPGVAPAGSVGPLVPTLVPRSDDTGTPSRRPQPSKSPPTSKPPGGGPAPSSPPPQAPPPPVHNDFSIVTTGKCFWTILYNAGENDLMVAAEFTISYRGDQATATTAPFTLTANPSDGYHSDGDIPLGTEIEETGGHSYQTSPFLGQQVTVTGTLNVTDDIGSDNAASITVSMPTLAQVQSVGIAPNTPHPTPCG